MTFQGIAGPEVVEPFVYQFGEAKRIVLDAAAQSAADAATPATPATPEEGAASIDTSQLLSLTEPLNLARTEAWANFDIWWQSLDANSKWLLPACSFGGGLLAFIFGIVLPGVAASLVTALMGAVMMMTGVMRVSDGLLPEAITNALPHEPRSIMLALGVAMIIGALLQWTFFRKPADKSE
jgi:ABC-type cobalamin transport system permease subunit